MREGLDNLKRKIKDREENAKKSKTTESPQTASDTMNMKEECDVMQASFDEACQQAIQDMQAFIQYVCYINRLPFDNLIDGSHALHRGADPGAGGVS